MFPWVNRVKNNPYHQSILNPFQDTNKYPLHGLYPNTKRNLQII